MKENTLTFKQFMDLYDNWNGTIKVNDEHLEQLYRGSTFELMEVQKLYFDMIVMAFGVYGNELTVRVKANEREGE